MRSPLTHLIKLVLLVVAFFAAFPGAPPADAQELGFWEDFALAENRETALKQLIPGTEDYYFFHCLHYQNTERYADVERLLKIWLERHGRTGRYREIEYRQALLTYDATPDKTLGFVRSELNLQFNHQREVTGEKPNLPTSLDPSLIARGRLADRAYRQRDLRGFEATANRWLASQELSPDKRRLLLQRLDRPDIPNLVDLVDADLRHARSGGFGSLNIHRMLLRTQLDELAKRQPSLLNHSAFVRTYLTRLAPNDDEDWGHNPQVKREHLERLWEFVEDLAPVHNSLKAHVLYRLLALDRSEGVYNRARFEEYLRLPRNVAYVNPEYLRREELRRFVCNLGEQFPESGLPVIGNDEPLVRSYLLHFFVEDANYTQYLPLVRTDYLKQVFAEAKIVNHVGDAEQWASLLDPAAFQRLKDRVDLDFVETNQKLYQLTDTDPVNLDLYVKNVETLLVKVFKINTDAFYRANGSVVNTDLELDGLIPNWQETYKYTDPPLHRVRRHFEFPELAEPGVYVVDFIGNGRSSRALIQKGQLRAIPRTTPDGQLLTIVDDNQQQVKDVSVLMNGKVYHADESGRVLTPFSTQSKASSKSIVIFHEDEAFLDRLTHQNEQYSLSAGIYVAKESLLARREGRLFIRPQLTLNGEPMSVTELEEVELVIRSTDLDGTPTTQYVPGIELFDDRATEHVFLMPPRVASMEITLQGAIQPLSKTTSEKTRLSVSKQILVNNFDETDLVADLHLSWVNNRYAVMLLGRTGEPLPDRAIHINMKHHDFTQEVTVSLKTDDRGIVDLGPLPDIDRIAARYDSVTRPWVLRGDDAVTPSVLHGVVGQPVQVPLPTAIAAEPEDVSLLELRHGQFVADRMKNLRVDGGLLSLVGLEPGDYDLLLRRPEQRRIRVRITEGAEHSGFACGQARFLELRQSLPLGVREVSVVDGKLRIDLQNASPDARVHILGSRMVPAFSCIDALSQAVDAGPQFVSISRRPSLFAEGRTIGEEYRYILERKLATKFPGNMLQRPSLLLNPWALRSTTASKQDAAKGDAFDKRPTPTDDMAERAANSAPRQDKANNAANLDFLAMPAVVLVNAQPNKQGRIELDIEAFDEMQQIRVVAANGRSIVERTLSLPARPWSQLDLRMADGLDPAKHFVQRRAVSILKQGDKIELASGATRVRTYDSLSSVFQLMTTLNPDSRLEDFRFVLQWPTYDDAKKRELYSKHASHELNFFLAHKDPKFFEAVVRPYMSNKRDKTFMDHFLLDQDLLSYSSAWRHGRLNVVERILIGHQLRQQASLVDRHIRELFELIPPNPQQAITLFNAAISNQVWAESDEASGFALGELTDQAEAQRYAIGGMGGGAPSSRPTPSDEAVQLRAETETRRRLEQKLAEKQSAIDGLRESLAQSEPADKPAAGDADADRKSYFARRRGKNAQRDQLYQPLDKTMEWAENNYYKRPIAEQVAALVNVNAYWNDYAHHPLDQPFVSKHFAQAASNATESMLALAVLDLPFEAEEHDQKFEGEILTIAAGSPLVVLHEELQQVEAPEGPSQLLVSQNFFQQGNRYRHENNVRLDKYVTDEFLTHTVYGCQIVVTNPTSTPRQLQTLFQLPEGAIAVANGKRTQSVNLQVGPYATVTSEHLFYFPATGEYQHFPVHVSQNGDMLASAEPHLFNVVESLSRIDRSSWDYISQNGTEADVMQYLKDHNLQRTNLDRIAFRMADPEFFQRVLKFVGDRRVYNRTLWSYGVRHNVPERIEEFLRHEDSFVQHCGIALESPLLHVDPIERHAYQHLDYKPLVNARAHRLGARRRILNSRLFTQYQQLLQVLAHRRELTADDRMSVTYYLLLQDRVEMALKFFESVNRQQLATQVQYDYFTAYTSFYTEDLETAERVVKKYEQHPVDRWRLAFANVRSQLDEIAGGKSKLVDPASRDQNQAQLAANSPSLDIKVDGATVELDYQNLEKVELRYYLMDVELLFSRNPFVQQQGSGQFAYIRPNLSETVQLPAEKRSHSVELPAELKNQNVLVEARAGGVVRTQAHYSNSMSIQVVERFGNLRVTSEEHKPVSTVYVKAYARLKNGQVKFYKDGYTDLRGRFDYASLSTNDLDQVERFSLLILSGKHGAKVVEAAPPAR